MFCWGVGGYHLDYVVSYLVKISLRNHNLNITIAHTYLYHPSLICDRDLINLFKVFTNHILLVSGPR